MISQVNALHETLLILDDAIELYSSTQILREVIAGNRISAHAAHVLNLEANRKATAADIQALRCPRLKRFSLNQLNLRLGKLAPAAPERGLIIQEIQIREILRG